MEDQPDSVYSLFNKLCEIQLGESKKCHIVQPKLSRQQKIQRLRKRTYDTLFQSLKGPHRCGADEKKPETLTVLQRLYSKTFDLRTEKKYDHADTLEHLVEKLQNGEHSENNMDILKMLMKLSGTGGKEPVYIASRFPKVFHSKEEANKFPIGPREYGDSCIPHDDNFFYTHFPSALFESLPGANDVQTSPATSYNLELNNMFDSEPGTGLHSFFSTKGVASNPFMREVSSSLFGGLVEGQARGVDIALDLPDIDHVMTPFFQKIRNRIEISEDEGFGDSQSSGFMSATPETPVPPPLNHSNIWEDALSDLDRPKPRYAWENVGVAQTRAEKPCISEAGRRAFDELYRVHCDSVALLVGVPVQQRRRQVPTSELGRDVVHLLLGVPSATFTWDEDDQSFSLAPGTVLSGMSCEALATATAPFLVCGNHYRHLDHFSKPSPVGSQYETGMVFQAFCGGIRKYLQHYRACILTLSSHDLSIMGLRFKLHKVLEQMGYLAQLCMVKEKTEGKDFPLGVALLSYLYNEALSSVGSHHYPMLLSLLCTTATPYLLFLQEWVFHGVCRDLYGEFMIQTNEEFLQCRDESYWSDGYTLVPPEKDDSVPLFLGDMANDIFVCGKSINLLKIIAPQHFLLCGGVSVPRVTLELSERHLAGVEDACREYRGRMLARLNHSNKARKERERLRKEEAEAVVVAARRAAAERIHLLHARIQAARRSEDARKRQLFSQLQNQMETDLKNRASKQEAEKAADRERMDAVSGQELLEANKDQELEKQAREELMEYYARLGADAAARERRALWHVRRRQLYRHRADFLQGEEEKLQAELLEAGVTLTGAAFDSDLPSWARVSPDQPTQFINTTLQEEAGATDPTTQSTATKDSTQASDTPSSLDPDSKDTNLLPNWAKRALEKSETKSNDGAGSTVPGGTVLGAADPKPHVSDSSLGDVMYGDAGQEVMTRLLNQAIGKQTQKSDSGNDGKKREDGGELKDLNSLDGGQSAPKQVQDAVITRAEDSTVQNLIYGDSKEDKEGKDRKDWKDVKEDKTSRGAEDSTVQNLIYGDGKESKDVKEDKTSKGAEDSTVQDLIYGQGKEDKQSNDSKDERKKESESKAMGIAQDSTVQDLIYRGSKDNEDDSSGDVTTTRTDTGDNQAVKITAKPQEKLPTSHKPITGPIRKTPVKQHIKLVAGVHATTESTEETVTKPSVRVDATRNILHESEEVAVKSTIRTGLKHVSTETQEDMTMKSCVKSSGEISRETEEGTERRHLKMFDGQFANKESVEEISKPGIKPSVSYNATKESAPQVKRVFKPNPYGHMSEISTAEFSILAPKLKRNATQHASLESAAIDTSFTVKSGRRKKVKGREIGQESAEHGESGPKFGGGTSVRLRSGWHVSAESAADEAEVRAARLLDTFRARNRRHGHHAMDSTAQNLMYGGTKRSGPDAEWEEGEETGENTPITDMDFETGYEVENFRDDFKILDHPPILDLSMLPGSRLNSGSELDFSHHYVSLPSLLQRSVTAPIHAQCQLVNQCVISHVMGELKVQDHFKALRRFLLMKDGEFAQSLADQLFEKLASNPRSHEVLNPVFLNNVLARALSCSLHGDDPLTQNLSFVLRYLPPVLQVNAPHALDCVGLTYRVSWPLSVVVTESSVGKYGRLFSLMLQLKRTVWTLKDMWHTLKRDAMLHRASNGIQFRQLQLYRHEMQHFVKVMQGYLAHQVVHVSWGEFQAQLATVHSLDHLHHTHSHYLNQCLFRCLLNQKAEPVMKIIQDIFALILKFRAQLISAQWQVSGGGEVVHPAFGKMCATYKSFSDFSRFLFKVVTKLAMRGYQPHLQELLLRLNFNGYYDKPADQE